MHCVALETIVLETVKSIVYVPLTCKQILSDPVGCYGIEKDKLNYGLRPSRVYKKNGGMDDPYLRDS